MLVQKRVDFPRQRDEQTVTPSRDLASEPFANDTSLNEAYLIPQCLRYEISDSRRPSVVLEFKLFAHVEDAAQELVRIADQEGVRVLAEFRGHPLIANPGMSASDVISGWEFQCRLKDLPFFLS